MITILVTKKSMTPVDIHVHVFKEAGHQQINYQIYHKFSDIIRYAIKYYYLVKKNSINLNF